jgi:hypothetical protein
MNYRSQSQTHIRTGGSTRTAARTATYDAWNFGYPTKTRLLRNGSYYNLILGKRRYLSQEIWVNRRGGYCALAWGGDQ